MTGNPASVRPETPLREVARTMRSENTGIVPVSDQSGRLLGVVTDRDIVMRTLASDESPEAATARDVMTDEVEAVTPDEELHDVVRLMGEHQVRRVPVVERGDRLVGIISLGDIAIVCCLALLLLRQRSVSAPTVLVAAGWSIVAVADWLGYLPVTEGSYLTISARAAVSSCMSAG